MERNSNRSSTTSTNCLDRDWMNCQNCSSGTSRMPNWRVAGGLRKEGSLHTKCPRLSWMLTPGSLQRSIHRCVSIACILVLSKQTWASKLEIWRSRRALGELSWWRSRRREAWLVGSWTAQRSPHSCNVLAAMGSLLDRAYYFAMWRTEVY